MSLAYRLEITPDDGTLMITCPALPEVTTFAEEDAEIGQRAGDAIEEAIGARIAANEEIPFEDARDAASWVSPTSLTTLKASLYMVMRNEGVNRAELARRLGWHREQVDRLFRLDHASKLDQLQAAAEALGFFVSVELKRAA